MPERAQAVRYGNAMGHVFADANSLRRTVHMHTILQKRKTEACKTDAQNTLNTLVDPRNEHPEGHNIQTPQPIEAKANASQILRAHCCVPGCHSAEIHAIVGPPETPIAGINIYDRANVFACSPPMLIAPCWTGAEDMDYRLQTACETPDNVDRHEFKVETKNKRLRVIITAFNKYDKQVGNPQKYFFNFKSAGLILIGSADTMLRYNSKSSNSAYKGCCFPILEHPFLRFAFVVKGAAGKPHPDHDVVIGLFDYMNMATVVLDNDDIEWNKVPPDFINDYGGWREWFINKHGPTRDEAAVKLSKIPLHEIMDNGSEMGPFGRDQGAEARAAAGLMPFLPASILLYKVVTDYLHTWLCRYDGVVGGIFIPDGTIEQRNIMQNSRLAFNTAGALVCKRENPSSRPVYTVQLSRKSLEESMGPLYDEATHGPIRSAKKDGFCGVFEGWNLQLFELLEGKFLHHLVEDLEVEEVKPPVKMRQSGRRQTPIALNGKPGPTLYHFGVEKKVMKRGRPKKGSNSLLNPKLPSLKKIQDVIDKITTKL